jgi:hypothetical protein
MATGTLELLAKELALALEQRLSGYGRDAFLAGLGVRLRGSALIDLEHHLRVS